MVAMGLKSMYERKISRTGDTIMVSKIVFTEYGQLFFFFLAHISLWGAAPFASLKIITDTKNWVPSI